MTTTHTRRADLIDRCRRAIETGQPGLATLYGNRYLELRAEQWPSEWNQLVIAENEAWFALDARATGRSEHRNAMRQLSRYLSRLWGDLLVMAPPITITGVRHGDWGTEKRTIINPFHRSYSITREDQP